MKSERGFALIETLVALALLGIIAVAFLSGLATTSQAGFIANEQATAESLVRSEAEYVRIALTSTRPRNIRLTHHLPYPIHGLYRHQPSIWCTPLMTASRK